MVSQCLVQEPRSHVVTTGLSALSNIALTCNNVTHHPSPTPAPSIIAEDMLQTWAMDTITIDNNIEERGHLFYTLL